jgi:hypothetical protein
MGKFKTLNKHHSFKVERNAEQQVAVWYKLWSRHRVWKPFQQDMNGHVVQQGGMPVTSTLGIHTFFKADQAPPLSEIPPLKGFGANFEPQELKAGIDIVLDKMQSMTLAGAGTHTNLACVPHSLPARAQMQTIGGKCRAMCRWMQQHCMPVLASCGLVGWGWMVGCCV